MLTSQRIFRTWWPLAASWLLMSAELPLISAVVARLPNPEINLAAYGGIVFPLALIIESPIIMLLAASTTLSKDLASYRLIWRFMMVTSAVLTGVHILVVFTPLYYTIVEVILHSPPEIIEPGRIGLIIMIPWTWSIAYRRFNQGVLIRFGHSRSVGIGTLVRLSVDVLVLSVGYLIGSIPGIVVASSAVAASVISEAIYVGLITRPVVRTQVKNAPAVSPALSMPAFLNFYLPLVLTALLMLLANPIGTAAIGRMPFTLNSLAVWTVITGLVFIFRSAGISFNEVVVALLDEPGAITSLRRFAVWLVVSGTAVLILITATPISRLWFSTISGLTDELTGMARLGLWFALPLPALTVLQSWFQGNILHVRKTTYITEAVIIYLVSSTLLLGIGVVSGMVAGLYVGILALTLSYLAQTGWLWLRSRSLINQAHTHESDAMLVSPSNPLIE